MMPLLRLGLDGPQNRVSLMEYTLDIYPLALRSLELVPIEEHFTELYQTTPI